MGAGISNGGQNLLYLCKQYVIAHTTYSGHAQVCKNYSAKFKCSCLFEKMPRTYTSEDLRYGFTLYMV